MVKLPQNYFENLSVTKYRQYLKLLPSMQKENTRIITMLIFTFISLSFLSLFAINPTLSTIIELQKELDESQFVNKQLTTKMNNLSALQEKYANLSGDLPYVYDAIPQNASIPTLVGQLSSLAQQANIHITAIQVSPVVLSDSRLTISSKTYASFTFTLDADGSYEQMQSFVKSLENFNRIVTVEEISLLKNPKGNDLLMTIKGREYVKQ